MNEEDKINAQRWMVEAKLRRLFKRMNLFNADVKKKKASADGKKGGHHNKRKKWAEEAARQITRWEDLPDHHRPLEIETLERYYQIYRDGDKIVAVDINTGEDFSLKRSSFEKRYL